MKRDMDLVRKILLAMEADQPVIMTLGYDPDVVGHHVWLMEQGDLITVSATSTHDDVGPVAVPGAITWKGQEFLDAVRDDDVWNEVNRRLRAQGLSSLPLELLQVLALKILAELPSLNE